MNRTLKSHKKESIMKKLLVLAILLITSSSVFASTTTLSWDPSPSPGVVGYKIYYSTSNTQPYEGTGAIEGNSPIDVGDVLSADINDLLNENKYYFAVTAYDAEGHESVYSNIVAREPLIPDLDNSWSASDGIFLTPENLVTIEVSSPLDRYIKKIIGTVSAGQVSCIELNAKFNGETTIDIYAMDDGTGEIISSQSAMIVDEEYGAQKACVVYQKNSSEAELFIDFGRDIGVYEFQKMRVNSSTEYPPIKDFHLSHMSKASISGCIADDNWEWTPPSTTPDAYRVVIAKTLKGVLGKDSEALYVDMPIQNVGQSTLEKFSITPELEEDGYFIAISAIYGENESIPVIDAHLPGNVIGTADDNNPTLFRNIEIDKDNDWMTVYGYYRARTVIPAPSGPAEPEERASISNRSYIIRYDYSYSRSREYKTLKML